MSPGRLKLISLMVLLAYSGYAAADSNPRARTAPDAAPQDFDQIVYKGVVGNVLDGIPMDPSRRVSLQRTNAILSNTFSGRSLGVLAGLSNPALLIGGLVWGIWSASNIKAEDENARTAPEKELLALLDPVREHGAGERRVSQSEVESPVRPANSEAPAAARPPVFKVWLPQRPAGGER